MHQLYRRHSNPRCSDKLGFKYTQKDFYSKGQLIVKPVFPRYYNQMSTMIKLTQYLTILQMQINDGTIGEKCFDGIEKAIIFGPIFKECKSQFNKSPKVSFQPNIGYGDSLRLEAFLIGWRPQMNVETSCFCCFCCFCFICGRCGGVSKEIAAQLGFSSDFDGYPPFPGKRTARLKKKDFGSKKDQRNISSPQIKTRP